MRNGFKLFCVVMAAVGLGGAAEAAELVFEFKGGDAEAWDVLDLNGDGSAESATNLNCPPGYGPDVLRITGTTQLAMAKGAALSEGTFVALYHENDARDADADGVILFAAQYPQDIEEAHNTKQWLPHVWLEQDNDAGFQFRYAKANGEENTLAERAGYGVVTDEWNETGWIWQKVQVEGGRARAKYWPAHLPEPEDWAIEAESDMFGGERFGVKVNSGDIHLAYFAAAKEDIPVAPPAAYLHFALPRATQGDYLPLVFFTNAAEARTMSFGLHAEQDGRSLASDTLKLKLPAGPGRFGIVLGGGGGDDAQRIGMRTRGREGVCTVALDAPEDRFDTVARFRIEPVADLERRLRDIRGRADALAQALEGTEGVSMGRTAVLLVLRDAARGHLDRVETMLKQGEPEAAERSLDYAQAVLAELRGYKGGWLREVTGRSPNAPEMPVIEHEKPKESQRLRYVYSPDFQIRFGTPAFSAQSLVMGQSYTVTIPWSCEGGQPDRDFAFDVRLASPFGNRIVARSTVAPATPTSQWQPGETYVQEVQLDVLPELPDPEGAFISQPVVLDETHRLLVTVSDPGTGASLLLGNEPGPQPDVPGASFQVADAYVSSAPFELRAFEPIDGPVLGTRMDRVVIRNVSSEPAEVRAVMTALSDTGDVVWQGIEPVRIEPDAETAAEFHWTPTTAGRVTLWAQVWREGKCRTQSWREVFIAPAKGAAISIGKANTVRQAGDGFVTPVTVRVKPDTGSYRVEVRAGERLMGSEATRNSEVTVEAEPWFGYYDVSAVFDDYRYQERLIATVVETEGTQLLVNGEPFLVKGVNVHGMDPGSRPKTALMMRIMRDLGFNCWRGDYPPRWQVDLAYEMNTAYTVLGPFSVAPTSEVFARQDGPPMATARELSRLTAQRYRDSAGVLLWNSCNELGGDTIDFLISQYPVYHNLDPYRRPVHYANLYGQDYHQGQDLMGTNSYFGRGQRAVDRQPILERTLGIAKAHDMPLIFCEFNSWYGAVMSTGVEAMYDLFAWGADAGMAGGFQYMKGNSDRHPGIFDPGFNTHKIYDEAIIETLADARVEAVQTSADSVRLRIVNKRDCTLRDLRLELAVSGRAVPELRPMKDLEPRGVLELDVTLPQDVAPETVAVTGSMHFVTHYGFKNTVPVHVFATP